MHSRGKGRSILFSLVGVVLVGLLAAGGAFALPPKGGPAIIDAAWDGTSTLNVVFSADVSHANWQLTDIAFTDTNVVANGSGSGDNDEFITFGSFVSAVPDSADSIYIAWIEAIVDHNKAFLSNESTPIAVNRGPIIRTAVLATSLNDDPTDDVLTLVLSEAATDLDSTDFVFSADVVTESLVVAGAGANWTISNFYWDAPTEAQRDTALQLLPYITTIAWAPTTDVTNAAGDTANSFVAHQITNAEGCYILDAAYDSVGTPGLGDDTLYVIYNMPVRDSLNGSDAASIDVADYAIGGTGTLDLTGANPIASTPIASPWMPWVVKFTNPAAGAEAGDLIAHSGAGVLQNDYWDLTTGTANHAVSLGPIIVAAYYKDAATDSIIIYFSQNVTQATVTAANMILRGFTVPAGQWNGSGRRFAQSVTNWTEGASIALTSSVVGSASGEAASSGIFHPVRDLNAPLTTDVIQVRTDLVREFSWSDGMRDSSVVRIAWREASGTDKTNYYRIFTRIGDAVSDTFVNENWANGVPVFNPTPGRDNPIIAYINISPDSVVSNGDIIEDGDIIHFGIVGADWNGNYGVINFSGYEQAIALQQTFVAGHPNTPRDWIPAGDPTFARDDNVIHIIGHWNAAGTAFDSIYADSGCVEANASVVIYGDSTASTDTLAVANANGAGAWSPVDIGFDQHDGRGFVWIRAFDSWGNGTDSVRIVNDVFSTKIGTMTDPNNVHKIYANSDSIEVRLTFAGAGDTTTTSGAGVPAYDALGIFFNYSTRSRMWADFTNIDTYAGNDSIPFENWGVDLVDNDDDWDTTAAAGDSWDPADDVMNWPEPFVDENGNGSFDLGEEFWDRGPSTNPADSSYTAKVYDIGDGNLDYRDTDELVFRAVLDTIRASTSVTDESLLPKVETGFAVIKDLPVVINTKDNNENTATDSMLIDLDQVAPEVVYASRIEQQDSWGDADEEANLQTPGNPLFKIGEWLDMTFETPSDSLVDYLVVQIKKNGGDWYDMAFDPHGDWAADGGYPGVDGVDDDGDGDADSADAEVLAAYNTPLTDGVDNNNDGQIDNNADTLYAEYWAWDDDEDGMIDGTTIATGDTDGLGNAGTGLDYLPFMLDVAGHYASAGDSLARLAATPGGAVGDQSVSAADSAFHWFALNGFNINMQLVANLYDIADGDTFEIRGVAYDWVGQSIGQKLGYNNDSVAVGHWYIPAATTYIGYAAANRTGNFNPDNSTAERFQLNLEAPDSYIDTTAFMAYDIKAAAGIQVFDSFDSTQNVPADPATYQMVAVIPGAEDVDSVAFDMWNATTMTWNQVGIDGAPPYTYDWTASILGNSPPDSTWTVYFRTRARDSFGNWEAPDDTLVTYDLVFTVVDGVIPISNITSCEVIGGNIDADLSNGCEVPKDSAVVFRIADGSLSDRDLTNFTDVPFVKFEYRKVIQGKEEATGTWKLMTTVTGTIDEGDTLADLYPPVAVTWNTTLLDAGDYEIRAWAADVEGNDNKLTTFIFTAKVVETPLRAYIDPPARLDDSTYALYAKVFIHDVEVDHVDFQFYEDLDGNGLADDAGSWFTIGTDDNDDTMSVDPGGDIILREGVGTLRMVDSLNAVASVFIDFASDKGYIDYDGDGYSPRDPVVRDNGDMIWDGGVLDQLIIGDPPAAGYTTVSNFDAIEFFADVDGSTGLSSGDWIFRQNMGGFLMDGANDSLQVWKQTWNVAGLGAAYLVRSVATSELGIMDADSIGGGIPTRALALDTEAPAAEISAIALGNGGMKYVGAAKINNAIFAGDNSFLKIWASSADDDVAGVIFEYSLDGGATWDSLDVNNDNDFYVNLDDTIGFTSKDAIVHDVYADDTTFTVTATDILLKNGIAPALDDMLGMRIYPLIAEDTVGGGDADGDGSDGDDVIDTMDEIAPWCVYLDIDAMTMMGAFHTDTEVLVRARAKDLVGNTDAFPHYVSFAIQENIPPEADVIYALSNGDTVDVLGPISDGDEGVQLAAVDTVLNLMVTAEDTTTIDSVYLWYRLDPCYYWLEGYLNIFNNPWMRAGVPADAVYPYNFAWDVSGLKDGRYQFVVIGKDEELNETWPPLNPYEFGRLTAEAVIDTAGKPLGKVAAATGHYTDQILDEVQVGAELWLRAKVESESAVNDTDKLAQKVYFYYAHRVLDEMLTVQNFYPYLSEDLEAAGGVLGDETSYPYSVELVIAGAGGDVIADYYTNDAFEALVSPTKYDYTIRGGDQIEFGAQLASTDTAYVSYNCGTAWIEIEDSPDNDVDENGWFTAAWDPMSPVPAPQSTWAGVTDAYDLIAVLAYDYQGECGTALREAQLSEHKIVLLKQIDGPEVTIHGLFWDEDSPFTRYNAPGNPMNWIFGATSYEHKKTKLCGVEYEVFVTVDSTDHLEDSVKVMFDGDGTYYDMVHYVPGDTITLTITMNEEDFFLDSLAIFPDSIENARVVWDYMSDGAMPYDLYDDGLHNDGAADDGWWGTQIRIPVLGADVHYVYKFDIDMSGDQHTYAFDPRNGKGVGNDTSEVVIPADFWFRAFTDEEITQGVHTAVATAWKGEAYGTNLTSPQGPVYYIIDCTAPVIEDFYVSPTLISSTSPCDSLELTAILMDSGEEIYDILEGWQLHFQFATDDSKTRWVNLDSSAIGWDYAVLAHNGWTWKGTWPNMYLPDRDHIDNDMDGLTDEEDEGDYTFSLRVVAWDDVWNLVIHEEGQVRVDLISPHIVLTSPEQGTVVAWGETLTVCAEPLTATDAAGLDHYIFYYAESSGNWNPIDPTPIDNYDLPHVAADGENPVCVDFVTTWLSEERDQYVQFMAVAIDSACNECDMSELEPIVVAVNDITGPSACITGFETDCMDWHAADPHLAVSESTVVEGQVFDWQDVSIVELWVQVVGGTAPTQPVDVTNDVTSSGVSFTHDFSIYCDEGETEQVDVWMVARDADQNPDPNPFKVRLTVDRDAPAVVYGLVPFVENLAWYHDDDEDPSTVDSTLVVAPDPYTGDLTFRILTTDDDLYGMALQYMPTNSLMTQYDHGDWDVLSTLDFEPQKDTLIGSQTYYFWWLNIDADSLANVGLVDTIYDWRAVAIDWACNTNRLDETVVTAAWDTTSPTCEFFGDFGMGDGEFTQIAAGEDVRLRYVGKDVMTDISHAVFWYVEPGSGDTVVIGSADAVPESLDCWCNSWTAEIDWTTPGPLCQDTEVDVYVWAYDTPGNRKECSHSIMVEDKDPPTGTKLVDVDADADCQLVPREITETVLNNQTITFSGTVELWAQTVGCDDGIATVYFDAINAAGDTLRIGAVDYGETVVKIGISRSYMLEWNTLDLDEYGALRFPDGAYTVFVHAVDLEDNWETAIYTYSFVVDNTAPYVKMKSPAVAGATVDVERGSEVPITSATFTSYTGVETTNEDVKVTWYIRDHNDADCIENCPDCWVAMTDGNGYFGFDSTDVRPDSTRPYSWEWATWNNTVPLEVGNQYDIVAIGEDLVCNTGDICEAWAAGAGITINVIDETAPCATITHLLRYGCGYLSGPVEQPERERVRGFASLTATILRGDTDTEGVRFEYSVDGGETWILTDMDLIEYSNFTWTLNNWDSDQLAEGEVLFRAVAWDDVGNVCEDPATITLIVDRTAPTLEVIEPTEQICPFIYAENGHHIVPLIVKQTGDDHDIFFLQPGWFYEWKKSVDDTTHWSTTGMLEFIYDAGTGYYTGSWDVDAASTPSGKYDFRVTCHDSACNETVMIMAEEVVIDVASPYARITRAVVERVNGTETTTLVTPVNQGVILDITKGEPVTFYASVFDDEQDIPGSLETGVDSVFFQVSSDSNGTWYHIDVGHKDEGEVDPLYWAKWNTSALYPGDYWVRAYAVDECGNIDFSDLVKVHVIDNVPPRAAVICWEPDIKNDINVTTQVRIYATRWCTQDVDEVMFQYRRNDGEVGDGGGDEFPGKATLSEWVTFDIAGNSPYDDSLWAADLEIGPETMWSIGDVMDLRAVAITHTPGSSQDDHEILFIDPNPPITTAKVVANRFGRDLEPVHPDEVPWLSITKAELLPPTESNFLVEVTIDSGVDPTWIGIAKPWVLVTADRMRDEGTGITNNFEELVEMDPKWAGSELDPYLWGGYTYMGLLDSIGCGGYVYINGAVVEDSGATDHEIHVDVVRKTIAVHEVNNGRGTNGPVAIPGDPNLTVDIPAGNGLTGAILMTPTMTPVFPDWEEPRFFTQPVGQAYKIHWLECQGESCDEFEYGYWAKIIIGYDEEDLWVTDDLGRYVKVDEETGLLAGFWYDGYWSNEGISGLSVDTLNNKVTFYVEELCDYDVWSLVGITGGHQVNFYPWCDGYTNQAPKITATISSFLTEGDDTDYLENEDTQIWIDDMLVASGNEDDPDRDDFEDYEGYAIGNGYFSIEHMDNSEVSQTIVYHHSTLPEHRLSGGKHTLYIRYRDDYQEYWYNIKRDFYVDVVPVMADWHGGFLNGPCVSASDCYVGGDDHMIQVDLWDYESGVITQEARIQATLNLIYGSLTEFLGGILGGGAFSVEMFEGDSLTTISFNDTTIIPLQDMGLKMDVWLVDENEDDQHDIDEYMERNLIQTATPAMLVFDPPMCEYSSMDMCDTSDVYDPKDKLTVQLPLTADLASYDGHEIEVVLYSSKIEHIGWDSNLGQIIGIGGGGGSGDDDDEEFTKYIFGPFDCVGNVGTQFIARRYIIDAMAPKVVFSTPVMGSVVAPGSEIPVIAVIVDSNGAGNGMGSGLNTDMLNLMLTGPEGRIFEFNPATFDPADTNSTDEEVAENAKAVVKHTKDVDVAYDKVSMTMMEIDKVGLYTLTLEGEDEIGNKFTAAHSFSTGSTVLQITDSHVYPNPFDNTNEEARIKFNLGGMNPARVTVKIFDFAGKLVNDKIMLDWKPSDGAVVEIPWRGTTNDGTLVANGGYLAHIMVDDGSGVKTTNVKIAVRKE
ncbi:MAG: hypothetical protein JW958_11875 [Candidatus Eisenbacteria bacterium]|nr:hypothetical protein [Candidatus Eisenbacteria bacterium]